MVWEYKIVYVGLEALPPKAMDEDDYERRLHKSAEVLNNLGKEGWELVGFLPHRTADNLNKYHAVFKRATGAWPGR